MSKMACLCGGVISDALCPCPTEGWILREQEQETFQEVVGKDVTAFFTAVRAGRRDAWIVQFFSPQYPTEVSDEGIITDIMSYHHRRFMLSIAECEKCGRLWVQRSPGENSYRSFAPDQGGYAGALRSRG
jgi:hypothetical protein